MSSKVLRRAEGATAAPINWNKLYPAPADSTSPGDGEAAELRDRLVKLQQRLDADTSVAYQRGFRDGEAKAKTGVVTEMEAAVQRMSQSVRELVPLRARLRRDAESDVVQLALAIARRVLRREMSVDPSAMQALAHVALQKLERQEISRVYVHANQAAAVRSALESRGVRAEVVAELTREPGSLVFETSQGMLDASVKAQLEEIERGLTDRVNQ